MPKSANSPSAWKLRHRVGVGKPKDSTTGWKSAPPPDPMELAQAQMIDALRRDQIKHEVKSALKRSGRKDSGPVLKHGEEFEWVEVNRLKGLKVQTYPLTEQRRISLEVLHDAHLKSAPGRTQKEILDEVKTVKAYARMQDLWRDSQLFGTLIVRKGRSFYGLNPDVQCLTCKKSKP